MSNTNKTLRKPTFIKIGDERIVKSAIKRYLPTGNGINVYFNTSLIAPQVKYFSFTTAAERKKVIDYLDSIYL